MNIFRKIRTFFTRKWWYLTATEMTPPCPKLPDGRLFWVGSLRCQECDHNLAMGEDFDKGKWIKCAIKNNPKVLWKDNTTE